MYKYNRPIQPLPPADSLPFPGNLIRGCEDCHLRIGCTAPVPGDGPVPAEVFLCGEAPGYNEDAEGRPFCGQAGQYLNSLLFQCSIPRETVYVANVIRCRPPNNRTPVLFEVRACVKWLEMELAVVQPRIIVAMGATAISYFLGAGAGTVEHLHGKPIEKNGRIILPSYHPAAALHDTTHLRQCAEDFQVLRGLVKGTLPSAYHIQDEFPNPVYQVADTPAKLKRMRDEINDVGEFAVDTEICRGKLWSAQFSAIEGTAWFVPLEGTTFKRIDLTKYNADIIVHNYLFDVQYLRMDDNRFTDTMVQAYLCVTRDTPILKSDLSWASADNIRKGDILVGFDEDFYAPTQIDHKTSKGYKMRHLRKSTVENTTIRVADCYKVTLSDGRTVSCTGDHKWLVSRAGCSRLEWLSVETIVHRLSIKNKCTSRTAGLSPRYRIRSLVPKTWTTQQTHDAGWLAGFVDGEGCLTPRDSNGALFSIAQKMGTAYRKALSILDDLGLVATGRLYEDKSREVNDVYTITVSGVAQIMRLFGMIHPVRYDTEFWVNKAFPNHGDIVLIDNIEPIGKQDVVSITTSTGTYIANGLASHNCGQSQGLKELAYRLCGIKMQAYSEIVRKGQLELTLDYLNKASKQQWPDPEPLEETKWDNKKGCLVTKPKKPWNISRKVTKILQDMTADPETDPHARWKSIPAIERSVIESVMGIMPESSLMDIPFEQAVEYAARDADSTLRVKHKLDKMIDDLNLRFVLDMDLKILPMVYNMMQNGMAVDIDYFKNLSADYDIRMRAKAAELAGMIGHPFNPASSDQVALVVYKELGFKPTAYTATGKISTDDAELKKVKHPAVREILEYRGLVKLKSTYADNMVRSAHPDESGVNRMHTVLTTTRVETGRLSSKKDDDGEGANLQNIPTRNKEGKNIRNGFIAPNGRALLAGDLGQIEVRTLAHLAKCKGLIELFLRGDDPHTVTASKIFSVPYEEAKKDKYRYPCKRAGFGVIYMIGAKGLHDQITEYISDLEREGEPVEIEAWSEERCQEFINDYYRIYPEIRDYQMEQAAMARRLGYVRDMFGRIRFIPEVMCPVKSIQESGVRMAANFAVTASAQGVIKTAMGRLWKEAPKMPWSKSLKWLIQIHDDLTTEVDDNPEQTRDCALWMQEAMTKSVTLLVPITVDFKCGKAWGSMEKVKLDNH